MDASGFGISFGNDSSHVIQKHGDVNALALLGDV
jgi:hypothetical protein